MRCLVDERWIAIDMKPVSIFFIGLSLAALSGCAPTPLATRPLLWQQSQFSATLPCTPAVDEGEPSVDHTPFGTLHGQTYACKDASRKASFFVTLGVFSASSESPLEQETPDNTAIATRLSREFCSRLTEENDGTYCRPLEVSLKRNVADADLHFGRGMASGVARVRVSHPYMVFIGAFGNFDPAEAQMILDVQLPRP